MSIWPITIRGAGRGRNRGSVALSAIAALAILLVVVLGMMAIGNATFLSGKRQLRLRGARAMAEAGIEYGYWQYAYNKATLPYTGSRSLGRGSFRVTVTDNSASIPSTIQIVSTGTLNGETAARTEVLPSSSTRTPFDYALCSNTSISGPDMVTGAGGTNGDIRANGDISLTSSTITSTVNGDAYAGGTLSIPVVTGAKFPGAASLSYPAIDLAYYQSIANRRFNSSQTFSGFLFLRPNEVVYVNGDITLNSGYIVGTGTLVAANQIVLNGDLAYAFSTDKFAGLAANGITVSAAQISVVGFYYAHNSSNTANASLKGKFQLAQGALAADTVTVSAKPKDKPYSLVHDPAMSSALGRQLHLPGY